MESQTAVVRPHRTAVSWVLTIALLYIAIDFIVFPLREFVIPGILAGRFDPFFALFFVFLALYLIFGYASWKQRRWGYLGGAIASAVFFAINASFLVGELSNPASSGFASVFTFAIASSIAVPYGTYGFYTAKRPLVMARQISRVNILALVGLGFAIGGLFIGTLAGGTQARLLATAGSGRDVTIVVGAANQGNDRFFDPETLTVNTGKTVVWFNGDPTVHTVTSTNPQGLFDSGNFDSGATYQFTFTQPGTYEYFCALHPWMKGKIIVQSG